eukprot:UN2474
MDTSLLDAEGHLFHVQRGWLIRMFRLDLMTTVRCFMFEGVCGTPALVSGILYAVAFQGEAAAFEVKTGKRLWTSKFCGQLGGDPFSVGVGAGILVVPGRQEALPPDSVARVMNDTVYGLNAKDGQKLWEYKPGLVLAGQNFTPAIAGDSLAFMNSKADVCCLRLKDGKELWKVVPKGVSSSYGGVSIGKSQTVYAAVNRPGVAVAKTSGRPQQGRWLSIREACRWPCRGLRSSLWSSTVFLPPLA